jgi:hypothetical protein
MLRSIQLPASFPALVPAVLTSLVLVACGTNGGKGGTNVIVIEEEFDNTPELVLSVEAPGVVAGGSTGYGLVLVYPDGETEQVDGTLESDLEQHLGRTLEDLSPTVAGAHTLTATTIWRDTEFSAQASLDVSAGPADVVDLALTDLAFKAGADVGYSVSAWDRFGNTVDTATTNLASSSDDLALSGGRVTGTVPGAYTVSATLDEAIDEEVLVVLSGDPVGVTLTLSDEDLELYETTHATVDIIDDHGNPVYADWTLSASGTGLTTTSGANVTFYDEGEYYVRVDVDDTSLWDEVGPLLIDSTGPDIDIDDPTRGDWHEGDAGTVTGTVTDDWTGVSSLEINGDTVTPAGDGTFSHGLTYSEGVNVIETTATDGDGNTSTDTRAVLAGEFLPYGDSVNEGIIVRLHEGDGGLGTLETLGEGLIGSTDLASLIPSPVVDESSQTCWTIPFIGRRCVTWYRVVLYVTNPGFGGTDLSIDPTSAGVLDTRFRVSNIVLNWNANLTLLGIGSSASGNITANSLDVDMDLRPYVSSNQLGVQVASVNVTTNNFYFNMNGALYDVLSFFGLDAVISSAIAGFIESAVEGVVQDSVPSVLEDALGDLEIGFDLDLDGNSYAIDALPHAVNVDDTGLDLSLETTVSADRWESAYTGLGSLYSGYGTPSWTGAPGTIIGLSDDFLNQLFYALWGGGILDMELSGSDLGLDPSSLEILFPGLTDLTITTEALLPPVVMPDAAGLAELQIGDLNLTLWNGDAATGTELIDVYISVFAELDLSSSSATSLSAELGAMDLYFDVVYPDATSIGAADTEALLQELVPLLLPTLTGALAEVPIPDIQGFSITGVSVDSEGPESGYITLGGDLTER